METKANYSLVGFFTVLVVLAAFGFIYWMAEYGRGGPTLPLLIRIPGSANGLSVGSPVRFNGIQVGSVTGLSIDRDDPAFSLAQTQVQEDAPIRSNTKAVLEIQGLTGSAYVELSGGAGGEDLFKLAEKNGKRAVLMADQSSVTNLLATADKIMQKADDTISQIQVFVQDSRQPLTNTVKNAETFSKALADNAQGIDTFLKSVSALSDTIKGVSARLNATLSAAEDLLKAVDKKKVDQILANTQTLTRNVAEASGKIGTAVDNISTTAKTFNDFGLKADGTLDRVDKLVAAIDSQKISGIVDNVSVATAQARQAMADIQSVSSDVKNRKQDIDQAISDFTQMANRLNNASTRVDGILAKVDKLLGSDDTNSLSAQARATLQSIKDVADNLNKEIGPIADNLKKFSSSGLGDVTTLVNETRQTVRNLDDTITNLNRDPQRLIFGGDNVKQYDGRMRR
ncbi:MCE family protein [Allorhizobium sp. BGMRC 0089]|uniref:MlaD family protein n=1 Tax=Allorhizobium sonneratiae TaxID=2934936 RepID=UPI002033E066|nr:MlaD family protein [Allorhizobium sonneratiae]MCM2293718.1 MCE family protein [Allorhizobium sonneratiae]